MGKVIRESEDAGFIVVEGDQAIPVTTYRSTNVGNEASFITAPPSLLLGFIIRT